MKLTCNFLLLVLLFAFVSARAQTGSFLTQLTFLDSLNSIPITTAEVSITNSNNEITLKGFVDEQGTISVELISGETYSLNVSAFGYKPLKTTIRALNPNTGFDSFRMAKDPKALNVVAVDGQKPIITPTIEGLKYDVSSDPDSKNQTLLEIIKKVPLLSVNINDAVLLKGSSDFKFYVNGVPSTTLDFNAQSLLKSMPASSVQTIEVITHPSSRYDAEGVGGIINIVTKKNVVDGYNGSFQLGYAYPYGPNANLNITVESGKFTISQNMGYADQYSPELRNGYFRESLEDRTKTIQDGSTKTRGHMGFSTTEVSYEADSLNLFNASLLLLKIPNSEESSSTTSIYDQSNSLSAFYDHKNDDDEKLNTTEVNLNYQLRFKHNRDALLTTSYKFLNIGDEQTKKRITADYLNTEQNYIQKNRLSTNEQTGQIDFVYPFQNWSVESGIKGIFRNNYSKFNDFLTSNNMADADVYNSDELKYRQNVYSIYNSYDFRILEWKVKAGARLEATTVDGDFSDSNTFLNKTYTNVIPSLIVQKEIADSKTLNISYNQRLQRPSIWQLNPFIDESDHLFRFAGNVELNPTLIHDVGFTYSDYDQKSFTTGVFHNFSNNSIQNVTKIISDTISFTQPENTGKRSEIGNFISYGLNKKKLVVNVSSRITYVLLKGSLNGQSIENKGMAGNIYAYSIYRFGNGFSSAINLGYTTRSINLQGESSGYYMTSLSVRKKIFKDAGNISFDIDNPFEKYRTFTNTINGEKFHQRSYSNSFNRTFSISFSYNFGNSNSYVQKSDRSIRNDDVNNK
jgi:hypothetical protein